MGRVVELPLWLLILVLLFAAVTFASHFLFPSVRWFFRKRAERVVARINHRLPRPIEPFKLARRYDTIQRLTYDAEVLQAISERSRETGIREDVLLEEARDFAREIVPAFSATIYFGLATRLARWLSRALYRVRIVHVDPMVDKLPEDATVVFVINHRSNMDYVLLTYLVSDNAALSFAMGQWARRWPLQRFLRAIGGYFVRAKSHNPLYRKVLARYVQMATREGMTQAVFPEGGLSLDGALRQPKLGILHYIMTAGAEREVIFVPVSFNYDRVLEDRVLIKAGKEGHRRFRVSIRRGFSYGWKLIWRRIRSRDYRFGHAAVVFGTPVGLTQLTRVKGGQGDLTAALAKELMVRIAAGIPVLPVPLVAEALVAGNLTRPDILARVRNRLETLKHAHVYETEDGIEKSVEEALNGLALRKLITLKGDAVSVRDQDVLTYYARSIAHLLPAQKSNKQ